MRAFHDLTMNVDAKPFMVGAELVTTRGSLNQPAGAKLVQLADALAASGKVDWVSVTDNAGGNPMESPTVLAKRLMERGLDTIVHLTCKDRNRNALEATAWQLHSEGLTNVLCLTGDYPASGQGYFGTAAPVFDLDSPTLCRMLHDMNGGLRIAGRKPGTWVDLEKTSFFIGCAVSPFKANEAELMCQYLKLALKVANGAQFIIPQLGYDMRKSAELVGYLRAHQMAVPVFGNIYLLSKVVARLFNQQQIPGCQVSDALYAKIEAAAGGPDKGKAFFKELAAKQYACFKGLGYRGAYFGGFSKLESVLEVIELAESFGADDWKGFAADVVWPMGRDFYLYARDEATGLANPAVMSPELAAAQSEGTLDEDEVGLFYKLNAFMHHTIFDPKGVLYRPMKRAYKFLGSGHPALFAVAERTEKTVKKALFDCQDCGDCSLADCYFMCPGAACRKNQRNGPCGGSRGPLCESADVPCIWYRSYQRAKADGQLESFLKRPLILRDQELRGTSGWANYFLEKDHVAKLAAAATAAEEAAKAPVPAVEGAKPAEGAKPEAGGGKG